MNIAIIGIVKKYDTQHKYVDVVVSEDVPYVRKTHRVGIDIQVNRGMIITFLSGIYGVPPGQIVWPDHIIL